MSRPPITTAYCRYDGEFPTSACMDSAVIGLHDLGMKIIPFYGFGDIETDVDCGPEALVAGYIGDVKTALKKLGLPMPQDLDYPEELTEFYGRRIWRGTLEEVRQRSPANPVFVKPTSQKQFTGFVWNGDRSSRLRIATYDDESPVFLSEVVNFIAEFRCYILDGEVLDVKRYRGDYSVGPAKAVVEAAVAAFDGPRGYAIDFGVTEDGRTLIVEVNDGFALGNYGLHPMGYARMIEARWEQLTESLVQSSSSSS
jgi:hypothetical protein